MPGFMSRGASIFEAVVSAWPSYQTQHNHSESLIWEIYSLRTPLPYLISKPPQWKRRKCCLFVFLWHLCRKVKGVLLLGWQMSELKGCWIWLQRGYKDTHTHTHVSSAAPSASSEQQVVLLTDLISPCASGSLCNFICHYGDGNKGSGEDWVSSTHQVSWTHTGGVKERSWTGPNWEMVTVWPPV